VPDAAGNNTIRVDVWAHPRARGERARRQVTEAAIIQADGRARAGLRGEGERLDTHLWTDVPVPELGPVQPVLWQEVEAGPDGLMLTHGMWLECIPHAAKAYAGLFTADGLKSARKRRAEGRQGVLYKGNSISEKPCLVLCLYQRVGERQRPHHALALMDLASAKAWLEERLGRLRRFEV
jgi:hypothetical protein